MADILEYRQLTKLKSTYADGLQILWGRMEEFIPASIRLLRPPAGSAAPIRTCRIFRFVWSLAGRSARYLRRVRGCVFIDADYSQIELRVLAHLSGDEKLIQAYREARDIHRITAYAALDCFMCLLIR